MFHLYGDTEWQEMCNVADQLWQPEQHNHSGKKGEVENMWGLKNDPPKSKIFDPFQAASDCPSVWLYICLKPKTP